MTKHTYAKNAAVLTATGFLLRAIGMFFRIYFAGLIGAAGMGLFQLIATVYALAATFATAGLSVVATRITSEQSVKNIGGLKTAMRHVLMLGIVLGGGAFIILFAFAPLIGTYILHDEAAVLPLRILAPSLPFMALSAVLRGYFLAVKRVGPNVRAQLFEQGVRIVVVMSLLAIIGQAPVAVSVAAIVVGNTVSEAFSWVYLHFCYNSAIKKLQNKKASYGISRIGAMLAPIAASQYSTGTLRAIENIMVPFCLAIFIGSREIAVEQFGALKGMAIPVLFFPFSFIGTLATLLLPDISTAYVQNHVSVLRRLVARVLLLTISVSVLAGGLFTVFSSEIALILYNSKEIGFYLQILGPLTPFMYLESMVDGILKGVNEQVATFRYTVFDCVIRIVLIYLLLPHFGIMGFLYIMVFSNLFTCLLNLRRLLRVCQIKFKWREYFAGPVLAAVISGASYYALVLLPFVGGLGLLYKTIIGGVIFTAVYMLALPACTGVKISQIVSK